MIRPGDKNCSGLYNNYCLTLERRRICKLFSCPSPSAEGLEDSWRAAGLSVHVRSWEKPVKLTAKISHHRDY